MKKIAKKILKIMLLVTISVILILFGFYVWLNQRLDSVVDKETYSGLVKEIKASEDLPDRFYEMYGLVTEFNEKSTTNNFLFYALLDKRKPCPCRDVSYNIGFSATTDYRFLGVNWITIGFALDKDVSPKKCLDFYLSRFDFLHHAIGIENASQFYYQKSLEQLADDEMLELSVMTLNPSFYSKIRRPEKLREKVEEVKLNLQ